MDFATLTGIVSGIVFITIGILLNGELGSYYNPASIMIVLGGTLAATLVAYPINRVIRILRVAKHLFLSKSADFNEVISTIIDLANIARKEGLLALEEAA